MIHQILPILFNLLYRGDRMPVYFKCKSCGKEHKSPIAFGDKKSFDSSTLENNSFTCPNTGEIHSYDKEDMMWKET